MVWDWRKWVLENLTDWESRAWPFSRVSFFFSGESSLHCVCSATYSKAGWVRGEPGQPLGLLHAFCGLCRALPALLMQQGSLAVRRAASCFHSLCTQDSYCDKAVSFGRWDLQLGCSVFSKMSVFLRWTRTCSELSFPLSFSTFCSVCVCF